MSLYRNGPSEATSFTRFYLTIQSLSSLLVVALIFLSLCFLPLPARAGFWDEMLTTPPLSERYPPESPKPVWDQTDINILCMVQIMDGLGRRQVQEINRFKDRLEGKATLVLASIDRDESKKWPLEYIKATWDRLKITIPICDLSSKDRKDLFGGFDPQRIRVLPQVFFFNHKRILLRIVEGFKTAEDLEAVLTEVQAVNPNPDPLPMTNSILVNGSFNDWPAGTSLPTGWEIRDPSTISFLHVEKTSASSSGIAEIQRGASPKRQILFQRLSNVPALLGKKVRLSAVARSNCIGKPVVALAMPTNETGRYRYAPESPFVTGEGKEIPLRILTACDFEANTQQWQSQTRETLIPDRGKLFVVIVYLEDSGAPLSAGQFDSISLEVLDK